jgi:Fe-S-cluster-containing dehydrogenase component
MKAAAVGAGAIALSPMVANASKAITFGPDEVGMLYDSTLCVGCKACVTACRDSNFNRDETVSLAPKDMVEKRWADVNELDYRTKNIIKLYQNPDKKDEIAFIKRQCMHCNAPGCVSACPVKAMTKHPETGIVEYDKGICIGCRYCQMACPFNVPSFEWHETFAKIVKCELCRETNLKEKGMPACVETCPVKAVIYGKRSDLMAEAKARIAAKPGYYFADKVYGEHEYGGTNVLYIAKVDFEKLGMPTLPDYSYATQSETIQHTIYKWMAAPAALYVTLCAIALKHQWKRNKEEKDNDHKGGHA